MLNIKIGRSKGLWNQHILTEHYVLGILQDALNPLYNLISINLHLNLQIMYYHFSYRNEETKLMN